MKVLLLTCFISGVHDDGCGNGIAKVTMSACDHHLLSHIHVQVLPRALPG